MPDTATPKKSNRHRLRKWFSRGVVAIIGVAIVAAIVLAWMPKPIQVDTATAVVGPLTVTVDEDGHTRVKDRYIISAPLTGTLDRIQLEPGAVIEEDAEVARILPLPAPLLDPKSRAQAQAALAAAEASEPRAKAAEAQARAALDFAETQIKTTRTLADKGSIPAIRLQQAELELRTLREAYASSTFGVRVARHEAQVARAVLGRLGSKGGSSDEMLLKSPVRGVVLAVIREDEGVVMGGAPLLEIGDPAALEIVVDILTTDAVRIVPGARATIVRWGGAQDLAARVNRIDPKAFGKMSSLGVEERRVNVVLDLETPHEVWASLGDGYRVEASIVVWEAESVLTIPVSSVFKHENHWHVFKIDDGVARLQPVEIGQRTSSAVQIEGGLSAGDLVVVNPGERVRDGTKVRAR